VHTVNRRSRGAAGVSMSDHPVGQPVRVRWEDGSYYGEIVAIPEDETKRTVLYDDGEIIDEDVAHVEEDSFDKKRHLTEKQKVGAVSSSSEEEQSSSSSEEEPSESYSFCEHEEQQAKEEEDEALAELEEEAEDDSNLDSLKQPDDV
jgi:hypothetical protein